MGESVSWKLDAAGYFTKGGRRVVPVGANYWPSSCGVEMWARWPEAEMQADLDAMAAHGLNAIRFFLRWQDFEPRPGEYVELQWQRLEQFVGWCGERGIAAHPALFVGFMSGGIFWPEWKRGNLYTDPLAIARAEAFAERAATVLCRHAPDILALDLGNELVCLPDAGECPPGAVVDWCERMAAAIRRAWPEVLLVSGNEQNQLVADRGWRLGQQPGMDLTSMHGYPVPAWQPVGFDGMADPFFATFLPLYCHFCRLFAPVMLQEFGTIVTFGEPEQAAYLQKMLPSAWQEGANSFFWWCLRDINTAIFPYLRNGMEGTLGLLNAQRQVKPGLEFFVEFARAVQSAELPADPAVDALTFLWPTQFYPRDNPLSMGDSPERVTRGWLLANWFAEQVGQTTAAARFAAEALAKRRRVLLAGQRVSAAEARLLLAWVQQGGHLYWHGPDPVNWGPEYIAMLGALPVNYRGSVGTTVAWAGQGWSLPVFPRDLRVEVRPTTASVLARAANGLPAVLENRVGAGAVRYALPLVEEAIGPVASDPAARDAWRPWYAAFLAPLG